ncbi:MAG: protein kinase [Bacteroidota bacterium]
MRNAPSSPPWPRVKELFDAVTERPLSDQARWLAEACEGDTRLREAVERLLAAEVGADDYFGALALDLRTGDLDARSLPAQIGVWRVVREVGRGGMGQVLLGERADGLFDQRVAIKLVHPGLAPDLIARFRAERRILAGLDHPGIARLLDGGQAPDGRPYLAMEYVDGEPITDYADRQALSIDARLDLFAQVCEAVAYAHQHLVVHRDLKPSNVLVTDRGEVKLLDFGIAKLIVPDGTSPPTRIERRLLTPHYAAPEQVRGDAVTTATDVYALGVLLYELLTGHRPYGRLPSTAHQVEQAILETQPTLPSTAVLQGEAADELAALRSTSPARQRRRLQGDLDWILLTALRKEPEHRYTTAEAFARDVERHRKGVPVEARAPTVGYRMARFVRRHRMGVAATSAAVVLIAAFGILYTRGILAERDRTSAERDRAERVSTFLTDLLATADDPAIDQASILRLLEPAAARAEDELAADPQAQAEVIHTLGSLYHRVGHFERADSLLRRAIEMHRALHGPGSPDLASALYDLGYLYTEMGPRDSALVHFQASAALWRVLGMENTPASARSQLQVSRMLPADHPDKRAGFEDAMAQIRNHYGVRSPEVAEALHEYYVLGFGGGTSEEIEAAFTEALAIYEENGMGRHRYALHTMANLAHMLEGRGAMDESLEMYQRSAELGREILSPGSADLVVIVVNYGATLHERGQLEEADRVLSEVAQSTARVLPQGAIGIGQSHYWYGRNLLALGRASEAEAALSLAETGFPRSEPRRYRIRAERGVALAALGRQAEAEAILVEAVTELAGTGLEARALRHLVEVYGADPAAEPYRARLAALEE